jgi:HEPN domain-containing protein
MVNSENPIVWFEFADMDLYAATVLSKSYPLPIEIVCFHCQQAAEKYLKAFLTANGIMPPKIHELPLLCSKCMEINEQFKKFMLRKHYVTQRKLRTLRY